MAKESQPEQTKLISVIHPHKEEGWFCFSEYEIPAEILKKHGKLKTKTTPDLFAIMKDQVTLKVREILGI